VENISVIMLPAQGNSEITASEQGQIEFMLKALCAQTSI